LPDAAAAVAAVKLRSSQKGEIMGLFDQGFASKNGLSPAAIALLGLLAVKGYENRGKLGELLGGALGGGSGGAGAASGGQPAGGGGSSVGGALGGLLGGLSGMLGSGASAGSVVSGGLGDLLNGFNQAGHGDVASSWVKDGPNQQPAANQIEQSIGPDVLDHLAASTGLSRDELLKRLQQVLPQAVDALTPDGRVPTATEANSHLAAGQG
jgi:uncharacterized protein YidB (DUF937 family)